MRIARRLDDWNQSVYDWKSAEFKTLDVEEMIKQVNVHYKDVIKMSKRPGPNGQPGEDPVITMFKESVEDFKEHMPVMNDLGNPSLQERHWKKIFDTMDQVRCSNAGPLPRVAL